MTGSAIQLIQSLIGLPTNQVQVVAIDGVSHLVTVYDTQYITGAVILILTISTIYKLLLIFAKGLGGQNQ